MQFFYIINKNQYLFSIYLFLITNLKIMYILKISNQAFATVEKDKIIITPDYNDVTKYDTIGEAMKIASEINSKLESHIVKVISIK